MEKCVDSLSGYIYGGRYISRSLYLIWLREITAAMFYLHKHRIIHRDLKPEK
jgi:serine/threonine protein kinase